MKLLTDVELAALLGITAEDVRRSCREKGWPHLRPKRSVWRFTEEQVAEIVAMTTQRAPAPAVQQGRLMGQTARSRARHR